MVDQSLLTPEICGSDSVIFTINCIKKTKINKKMPRKWHNLKSNNSHWKNQIFDESTYPHDNFFVLTHFQRKPLIQPDWKDLINYWCFCSSLKMGHSRPLFLYFHLFNPQLTGNKCSIYIIFCQWLDSNRGPLVSEATALPTEPQPLLLFLLLPPDVAVAYKSAQIREGTGSIHAVWPEKMAKCL